ncbi:MAG: YicC family protein [Terrimicrobiaceae bacterium]
MKSMTGHGRGSATHEGTRAVVECSSVNRRSLEIVFVAPRELASLEPLVRETATKLVERGRLTIMLAVESADIGQPCIDTARARAYLTELRTLQSRLGLKGEIPIETILTGPGVIRESPPARDHWPCVHKALIVALEGLTSMRVKEGRNLAKALKRELRLLATLEKSVGTLAVKASNTHQKILADRIARAGGNPAEPRLAAEIVQLAERSDITEELARLASHRQQFAHKMAAGNAVGRTLEFLAQEFGREWNTIGSKSSDAAIARFVVEAKTAIDKLREQLANVE